MAYMIQGLIQDLLLMLFTYVFVTLTIIIPVELKKRDKISKFTARKIVHTLAGLSVLSTPFFIFPYFAILIAGSLTIVVFFSSKESKVKKLKDLYESIGEEAEEKAGRLMGPLNYCISITILVTVFVIFAPNQLYFPIAGILIMIFADTLASVIGKRWGKIKLKLPWTGTRTVLGSLTMFVTAFLLSLGSFWYFGSFALSEQNPLTWNIIFLYAFITSLLATIIEAISPSIYDDLTVPIFSTIIMYLLVFFTIL